MKPLKQLEAQFEPGDLAFLRQRLVQMGPDYEGAGELIQAFLSGLGYGISPQSARQAAEEFGLHGCTLEGIRNALGTAARIA